MDLSAFSGRDKQNFMTILSLFESEGATDIRFAKEKMDREIVKDRSYSIKASKRYKPDNVLKCSVCGKMAIKVPLSDADKRLFGEELTHAIQCQNRPAEGSSWEQNHCGHTEYIKEVLVSRK